MRPKTPPLTVTTRRPRSTDGSAEALFQPIRLGDVVVRNRIAMAPMTRHRSHLDGTPTELNVEHYRQRASAGLIITEGIYPSAMGRGCLFTPGLVDAGHVAGWRRVTDAVHEEGGAIFAQIMHAGRLSDPLLLPRGVSPYAPSAVPIDPASRKVTVNCPRPKRPYPRPRAMSDVEVQEAIEDFVRCTRLARQAGFDGVEIHGASGYLPMQFLGSNTNLRTDAYGGGVEGRARFLLDCVDRMSEVSGSRFVAVKLGPGWTFHEVREDDPIRTYSHVVRELSRRRIAFLELGDYGVGWDVHGILRPLFDGPVIGVGGFSRARAAAAIAEGRLEAVAFGQAFIANPDLVERFRNGWALNRPDVATYYTQGEEGYTTYPCYADADPDALIAVESSFEMGSSRAARPSVTGA